MEELKVLYEDNHIIVVIKDQNIPTQEDDSGSKDMLTMIKNYIKEKDNKQGNVYVGLVHRLDRPTGGVMIFAKTSKGASRLSESIRNNEVEKRYLAVVVGQMKKQSEHLTHYLKKNCRTNMGEVVPQFVDGAKRADLKYTTLDIKNNKSLLDVELITGRSHQIRIQLSTIGYPICSDMKYNANATKGNLALWCYKLTFEHPTTGEIMKFIVFPPTENSPWNEFKIDSLINVNEANKEFVKIIQTKIDR